jgi:hypothetical protein
MESSIGGLDVHHIPQEKEVQDLAVFREVVVNGSSGHEGRDIR